MEIGNFLMSSKCQENKMAQKQAQQKINFKKEKLKKKQAQDRRNG